MHSTKTIRLTGDQDSFSINTSEGEHLLLQQLAAGSRDAFTVLFRNYQAKLYYYLLPFTEGTAVDADEIIQDIFIKIWLKKETFAGVQHFEYYLYRMARNRLVDILRKDTHRRQHLSLQDMPVAAADRGTEEEIRFREYHALALKAIDLLPKRRRMIFEWRTQLDLSLDEISLRLGISKAVVKQQLHLATRSIREYLRRHGGLILGLILCFKIF